MGSQPSGGGGQETFAGLVKMVWDKIAQQWSSWGLPMKIGLILLLLAVVAAYALANWGPSIKGLFVGTKPAVIPSSPMTEPIDKGSGNTFNVTSTNQSGGQTAGVIHNYTPPVRTLDGKEPPPTILLRLRNPTGDVLIATVQSGDHLAQSIYDRLRQLGFTMASDGPGLHMGGGPSHFVEIASVQNDAEDPMLALKEWLDLAGYPAHLWPGQRANIIVVHPAAK